VAVPKIEMNQLLGFSKKMRMRGIRPSSKLLLGERISAQPEIVEKLRLPQWAPVFKIIRLRLGDGEPFAVETSYVPEALCPDLLKRDLEGDSLYRLLESEYGIELEHAEEIIEAVVARKRETEWLGIKVGAPLLFVKQVLYGRLARSPAANPVAAVEGWPILYEESLYRADKYQISVRLTRPRLRSERWGEGNP
jgi:GntR family transcriptional regulator